ncbi:hypothetical protein ATCC90586_005235 [Pythium insidiosum]|nr:hypothetical protein ATCC90586_005235 [Pythium insidiosum]
MKTLVVAGGGVVGLGIARAAARRGLQVFLLERNAQIGMETSSRNSEVVHAGIYYASGSWKARLCVRGRQALYEFCEEFGVEYQRCGKLIVAQHHQACPSTQRGAANGVSDLRWISREDAKAMEPHVECAKALFSPSTGIVDSHGLMLALQGDAEAHGACIAFNTPAQSATFDARDRCVRVRAVSAADAAPVEIECDYFVNAAGLGATSLLRSSVSQQHRDGLHADAKKLPTEPSQFAKGTYFRLPSSVRPFRHLVYPIPEVGGLGVHATVDLQGNVRFGPDVEWVDAIDYTPDPRKAEAFAERIRSYWPSVCAADLVPDYCGIRPKISIGGAIADDFYIADEAAHGIPRSVHLCGIESPGLTSALAIADSVVNMLETSH